MHCLKDVKAQGKQNSIFGLLSFMQIDKFNLDNSHQNIKILIVKKKMQLAHFFFNFQFKKINYLSLVTTYTVANIIDIISNDIRCHECSSNQQRHNVITVI
jgi:hypothetical protein